MDFDNKITTNQINLHLTTLDESDEAFFSFRAIKGKKVKQLSNRTEGWQNILLSLIEQEYQLFVNVNATDGEGLKKGNVTKVRALFLDMDKTNQDNLAVIEAMPIPPNLVVNTSKGKFHCYWDVVDCPLDQFTRIQQALAAKYNGDQSVSDLPRIMRLAGSYNLKSKPQQVIILEHHSDSYTLDEFISAFSFDSFGSANIESLQKNNIDNYVDKASRVAQLISNISNGIDLHHSLLSLAAYRANDGIAPDKLVSELQSLMGSSKLVRDDRFMQRYAEINGIVKYAVESVMKGGANQSNRSTNEYWPEPTPLVAELKPVLALDFTILPDVIRELVLDTSNRMQCPPDFLVVGMLVATSSIVARRVIIQPKKLDIDWLIVPNTFGVVIGNPSLLKTPTLDIAMAAIEKLEKSSRLQHEYDLNNSKADKELSEIVGKVNKRKIMTDAGKAGFDRHLAKEMILADIQSDEPEPEQDRFVINDASVEKVGELLKWNALGLLQYRDELSGFFNVLNKPDKANDRSFFLESWNGNKSYTYDRIGRGTIYIPKNRLSILGGIQPDIFGKIVNETMNGSQGGDGLLQRFQLAVYPDVNVKGKFVDLAPNKEAMTAYCQKIYDITEWSDEVDDDLILTCSQGAYEAYKQWYEMNEAIVHGGKLHPALESHFAKYRGLVPTIAGIFYVLNNKDFATNPDIDAESMNSAITYVEYLRSHAERIYALPEQFVLKGAKTLLAKFDKLGNEFTLRDVKRKKWSGLTDGDVVEAALSILEEHGYCQQLEKSNGTGRPSIYFVKHPKYQLPKLTKPLSHYIEISKNEKSSCKS